VLHPQAQRRLQWRARQLLPPLLPPLARSLPQETALDAPRRCCCCWCCGAAKERDRCRRNPLPAQMHASDAAAQPIGL
jgi:hypothetical protein